MEDKTMEMNNQEIVEVDGGTITFTEFPQDEETESGGSGFLGKVILLGVGAAIGVAGTIGVKMVRNRKARKRVKDFECDCGYRDEMYEDLEDEYDNDESIIEVEEAENKTEG